MIIPTGSTGYPIRVDMLRVENLTKTYSDQETPAIQGVSFFLAQGKITGIFGKSGSGKSTLLQMIAGLIQPDEGNIYLDDQRVAGPAEKLVPGHEEIKVVFQDFKLKHRMTVEENIDYMLLSYESGYRKMRLEDVLKMTLLREIREKPVEELSGGQRQRVAIARALANEPRLLLMDEPFSNLDIISKDLLKKVVENIVTDAGGSVLFVSHEPDEILSLSDHLIVLHEGKCIQKGTPESVYNSPKSKLIAEMFGRISLLDKGEKKGYYRPESFNVGSKDNNDFKGVVTKVEYLGRYQLLTIMTGENNEIRIIDHQLKYLAGEEIFVQITGDPVIRL